jgi:hypothetical protein
VYEVPIFCMSDPTELRVPASPRDSVNVVPAAAAVSPTSAAAASSNNSSSSSGALTGKLVAVRIRMNPGVFA